MRLQLFIWSTIINAIFSFAMVALILFSRPLTKVKAYWAAMCCAVGAWSFSFTWMSSSKDYSSGLIACQLVNCSAALIPTFLYHTVHTLLKKTPRMPLYFLYGSSAILIIMILSGWMLDVRPILDFNYYTVQKPAYFLFIIHLYGGFAGVEYILWRSAQSAPALIKKQLMSLFWGAGLGFLGGQMTILPVYGISLFPYGVFFIPIYIVTVGYGMLKYQFMDFRLAIRKLALTFAIYFFLLLIFAPVAWPLTRMIRNHSNEVINQILALSTIITILLAGGPLIYALVLHRTYWLRGHTTMALTHELKSPLATIRGAIEFLENQLPKLSVNTKALEDYTQILNRNTCRLENLVEDLLNIAAIQEGEINIDYKEFSLLETAKLVADHYSHMASQKGLKISIICLENLKIFGDQVKIEQVLSNLVSNSIKYSSIGEVEIKISSKENELACSVSDEGPGIETKELTRIFDRFFQGAKAVKGTGIGLAIAKAWVGAHRGKIWAESAGIGKGTSITFTLPRT